MAVQESPPFGPIGAFLLQFACSKVKRKAWCRVMLAASDGAETSRR